MIEMQLAQITMEDLSAAQTILLKEKDGDRGFSIVIGIFEAWAIKRIVEKEPFGRPLTHDLLGDIINAMGGKLTKIVVTALRKSTYHASLYIEQDGRQVEVDARPSDAIALAMKVEATIFVSEQVFEELSKDKDQDLEPES